MNRYSRKIEEEIRKAIESGAFENLPGKGEPLDLQDNPHVSEEWRLTHHLLRSNNFTLPWIQRRQEIEQRIHTARLTLAGVWTWAQKQKFQTEQAASADREWARALTNFQQFVDEVNKNIRDYNLGAPSLRFHRVPLKADQEIARVVEGAG